MILKSVKGFLVFSGTLIVLGVVSLFVFPIKGQIPILMYHFVVPEAQASGYVLNVSTSAFERQLTLLKALRFRPVGLDEFYQIKTGAKAAQGREILITFDDGNETFHQFALPILERFQFPAANFLIYENLIQKLHGSMDVAAAKRMVQHPLVTLGSHTLTHPTLTQISKEEARVEISDSKAALETVLEHDIQYFTYPTGAFDQETRRLVEESGYRLGFTTSWKFVPKEDGESPYALTRSKIALDDHLLSFWFKASGIHSWIQKLTTEGKA